jgi:mono/diheme cytochrome c family protein
LFGWPRKIDPGDVTGLSARYLDHVSDQNAVVGVRPMPVSADDFDAEKSAPQLFASDCSSCHRTPYGLAKA